MTIDLLEPSPALAAAAVRHHPLLDTLDARVDAIIAEVHRTPYWREAIAPQTPAPRVTAILREIFLSIHRYQPHTTEAGFAMLGRLPKGEQRLMKLLLLHKVEEAEHGLWALRDYLALGGTADVAKTAPDPATFAVAAVWWRLAQVEEPWSYLGAEYLFEYLTARLTAPLVAALDARGFARDGIGFVVEHATEDVKHTQLIRSLIVDVAERVPDSPTAILRGFDYFAHVYPLPVWDAAYARATGP